MVKNERRLIDVNAAIERAKESDKIVGSSIWETCEVVEFLEDCPILDAVEVVHGRWLKNWCNNSFIGHEYAECSICDCHMLDTNQFWDSNYCPNCGAKMDKNENP